MRKNISSFDSHISLGNDYVNVKEIFKRAEEEKKAKEEAAAK